MHLNRKGILLHLAIFDLVSFIVPIAGNLSVKKLSKSNSVLATKTALKHNSLSVVAEPCVHVINVFYFPFFL